MKTKFFLFLLVAAFAACKSNEPKIFQIKATDMISIKPTSGTQLKVKALNDTVAHLSALEIVKQTTVIQYNFNGNKTERVFESNQRDTISATPCLKMYGLDIINQEGNYVPEFIESTDCILLKFDLHYPTYPAPRDTLGYISNATLRAAEAIIKQAYSDKNMELMINTFNNAFTFIPISGAEYRALKAQNLQ